MDHLTSDKLLELGAAVAEVSDAAADRTAIDAARRAFLAPPPVPRASSRARTVALLAAACGAVMAALIWLWFTPRSLSYSVVAQASVSSSSRPGVVGEWVAVGAEAPLALRFSDHSVLTLAPGARARVTTTSPVGADVLIERGGVHAVISHEPRKGRWSVRAGPFEVRVTGTVFDASWDPVTESFELVMHQGSVVVQGPHIPPERSVVAGERLIVSVREGRMVLTTGGMVAPTACADPVAPSAPAGEPRAASAPVNPSAEVASLPAPTARPHETADAAKPAVDSARARPEGRDAPASPPAWKELAQQGKYREALAAAEAAGFENEVVRASAADLRLLADAARLGGSPARARVALLAARTRFGARGTTAFLLGKIAADQGGAAGEASMWLETYLREEANGAFAEQALGRLVELSRRDPEAASRAASRYLARYPNGAHAALAKSLVTRP